MVLFEKFIFIFEKLIVLSEMLMVLFENFIVLFEKFIVPRVFKNFPAFLGTKKFFTVFAKACHLSLS